MTLILIIVASFNLVYCDTVDLKDGSEVKGIIVEQYKDRVVLSTEYGETEIDLTDIKQINYDLPEQNLVALAERYRQMRDYPRAYYYYDKAKKVNPNCKQAIEGVNFLEGYLFRKNIGKKVDDVRWRQDVESFRKYGTKESEPVLEKLRRALGFELKEYGKDIKVLEVDANSPASNAGIKKGDIISSAWGRLTGYMSAEDVARLLTDTPQYEVGIKIDRAINVAPGTIKPSQLELQFDGLFLKGIKKKDLAHRAGLRDGDMIISVSGDNIRYTPKKQVLKMINETPRTVTVRRELTIWRTRK